MELALKKAKADQMKAEGITEALRSKVSEMEKSRRQAEKRIKELETQLSLNVSDTSNTSRRMMLLPSTSSTQSNGDLQSLSMASTVSNRSSVAPMHNDTLKPIRFSVKLRPKHVPNVNTETALAKLDMPENIERPALTWQRYPSHSRGTFVTGTGRALLRSAPDTHQRLYSSRASSGRSENSVLDLQSVSQQSQVSHASKGSRVCVIQ